MAEVSVILTPAVIGNEYARLAGLIERPEVRISPLGKLDCLEMTINGVDAHLEELALTLSLNYFSERYLEPMVRLHG